MNTSQQHSSPTDTLVDKIRAVNYCLARSRFSVIILVVGLALLLADQGRDLLGYYGERNATQYVALTAAAWAFSVWGWCRLLLDIDYQDPPKSLRWYNLGRKWVPRILGGLAFVVLIFSARAAEQTALAYFAGVGLIVFLALVILRRPAQRTLASTIARSKRALPQKVSKAIAVSDIGRDSLPPYRNFLEGIGMPKGLGHWRDWTPRAYVVLLLYAVFAFLSTAAFVAPVWLGRGLGAMVLFFAWAATWLPVGSLMSYIADKRGLPLLTALALLALVSSYYNDNHEIRHAPDGTPPQSRLTVTAALDAWSRANPPKPDKPTPFVVVATAGGGIRAAYWTTTVLGTLQEGAPSFAHRTFAISGVSGGSVGATVYRAMLAVPADRQKECGGVTACMQKILAKDLLGPLSAALLYPDLAQRFVPWALFPDRGKAFESGLERAFTTITKRDGLSASLGSLRSEPWAPALFLNSTWVDTGRRIVASNLRFARANAPGADAAEPDIFQLPVDEMAQLGYDLRLSTAAHNSARFPYVNPPGMWKQNGKIAGRLSDGGQFENYGAETAGEILELACSKLSCAARIETCQPNRRCVQPIVVLITSDPSLPENMADVPHRSPIEWGYEIRSTLRAYERTRGGRGAEAAVRLRETVRRDGGRFLMFRMCPAGAGTEDPPLGWALSDRARATIESYLRSAGKPSCPDGNASGAKMLQEMLK